MIKKLLSLLLCLTAVDAMGQVNLDDCQQWAAENHPIVRRYDIIKVTEECNLDNVTKNWLPMVSLSIDAGLTSNTADFEDLFSKADPSVSTMYDQFIDGLKTRPLPNWQYRTAVEVVQKVYDGGASSLQRQMTRKRAEVERAHVEVTLQKHKEKVLEVYFAIILLEDRKEQMMLKNQLLQKNIDKLRNLEGEGLVTLNSIEAFEVEQLKQQQSLDIIEENMLTYRTTLSLLTGHDLSTESLVRPAWPDASPSPYSSMAQMQLLDRESELLGLKNKVEQVKLKPRISLMGTSFYGFPDNNIFRAMVDRTPRMNFAVGVKMSWDITPFYTRKNNLALIRQEQQAVENQRELLVFNQRISNASLLTRIKRLDTIKKQDERIVELREKLRIAEETKVDNDIVDATQLLAKINDEADAKLQSSIHQTEIIYDVYKLMLAGDVEK